MKSLLHFSCRVCLVGMFLLSWAAAQAQTAVEAWVRRYNSGGTGSWDYARKVVSDPNGNIVVAGDSNDGVFGQDFLIIKYSGAGVPLWTNRYNGPVNSNDEVSDLAVDNSGNVFVTGSSDSGSARDYATVAYSGTGVPLWTNRYNGPGSSGDEAKALAVDNSGNVFVTGYSFGDGGDQEYTTIAYSSTGVALWTNRYGPGGFSVAYALAVDGRGNVFVTGSSGANYATIAYSGAGVPLWTNRYNGPGNPRDSAAAVAVDNTGNVFVTGSSYSTGAFYDSHYATIAYSLAGVALWTNRYNGPGTADDFATALAVGDNGNVFVTGSSSEYGRYSDYVTISYSGAGVALWTNRYSGRSFNRPYALAMDHSGNVLVTGSSAGDYATIKYSGSGVALWTNYYNAPGNSTDDAYDVSVDSSGNVFVTGYSGDDFATVAYSPTGVALWTNRYNGPVNRDDEASAIAVDHSTGNVLVTGNMYTGDIPNYVTVAYSEAGVALWTNRYNGKVASIAVGRSGNVFVTGSSYATIAYSASGIALWTNRYNGPGNHAIAISVDGSDNVFVTGYSYGIGSGYDYATIGYSAFGVPLWTNRYDGPGHGEDQAVAVAVNNSGTVFVTGSSTSSGGSSDYATIAYSGAGVPLWTNRYNRLGLILVSDRATDMAVDGNGNVFVTGYSSDIDFITTTFGTIAYSGEGVPLWTNRYNPGGFHSYANAVVVDAKGNVFVTGISGANEDYATVAYSAAGVPLWTNRYNGTANGSDRATAVAADRDGNVFVTGVSQGRGGREDYATIAYSGAGVPLWTNRYNGPANGPDQPTPNSSLAIGRDGAVYVAGSSDGHYGYDLISDYATIKYVWRPHLAIQPFTVGSSTMNLTLSAPPQSPWHMLRAPTMTGPWTDLGLSLTGTNGSASFTDSNAPANGAFYRVAPP